MDRFTLMAFLRSGIIKSRCVECSKENTGLMANLNAHYLSSFVRMSMASKYFFFNCLKKVLLVFQPKKELTPSKQA